jgi:hypothetical protein
VKVNPKSLTGVLSATKTLQTNSIFGRVLLPSSIARGSPRGVAQLADSGEELLITSGALHHALHRRRLAVLTKVLMRVADRAKTVVGDEPMS